jgi:transposase
MAGKILRMSQLKQVLQMHKQGKSKKEISRTVGISRNTLKSYLSRFAVMESEIEQLLKMEDNELEKMFFPGSPSYKESRYDDLKDKLDYFTKELKRTGVTRTLLWEEYKENLPKHYSYTQFCHHLQQHLTSSKPSMVLNHNAGEKMYVDFAGDKLSYVDIATGEIIQCETFIACLPYSGYSYVINVRSQRVEDFIYALRQALIFFEGVPQMIVPDNLKSAVIKADRYEPKINQVLEDFANHYGTVVVPARAYKPKDKALVENQVKLVYSQIFARLRNKTIFSLNELNEDTFELNKRLNQTRMQNKDYCREEKYLAEEKELLKPLPEQAFEIKHYKELKVAKNGHVMLYEDKHYYSVPYRYIGKKVKVVYTRSLVCIYCEREQIAVHQRSYVKGKYSYFPEHLCSHHQHYLQLSPEYYIKQASEYSSKLEEYFTQMFSEKDPPEAYYKRCNGLLSLARQTPKQTMDAVCCTAIKCRTYSYSFIKNLLENTKLIDISLQDYKPLPQHENIRGKENYC